MPSSSINTTQAQNARDKKLFEQLKELWKNSARVNKLVFKENRPIIIGSLLLLLILAAMPSLNSAINGWLINDLVKLVGLKIIPTSLMMIVVALAIVTIGRDLIYNLQTYLSSLFRFYVDEKFQIMILSKKADLDIASHEDPETQNLITRVTETGPYRLQTFVERQQTLIQAIVEVVIASTILAVSGWFIFLIIALTTIPEFAIEAWYSKKLYRVKEIRAEDRRRYWHLYYLFGYYLEDLIEMKIFQNAKHFLTKIRGYIKKFATEDRQNETQKLKIDSVMTAVARIGIIAAICWFIYRVTQGNLQIGTFTFLTASVTNFRSSLSRTFNYLARHYEDNFYVGDIFRLLDLESKIKQPVNAKILPKNQTPEIVFNNVSFGYPNQNKLVLKNISFTVAPGEKLALVGINGAGKTTLIKLLCRFYDPVDGQITIGGIDLKELDLESWYYHLGALFQNFSKYNFSIREAIAIGQTSEKINDRKVREAARAAEAEVFINEWKDKYHQQLGRGFKTGVEPSGGQWQKLALARVLYRGPNVFILDEPTAAVDAEAEERIFNKLEDLPKDKTVILISHRFSTVRRAHKIAVIQNGEIIEFGSHHELLNLGGTYARMFKLQAKGYE